MIFFQRSFLSAGLGIALTTASAGANGNGDVELLRERAPNQRPALMVLGTGHLANPIRDVVNIHVDDVLTDARQAQIKRVVEELASYRPTHIAVEWSFDRQDALDARYRDYRSRHYQPSRSEVDQIGLRLAASLGLAKVYAVDWNESPPGCDENAIDWSGYGQSHGQKAQIAALMDPQRSLGIVPLGSRTIGEWLWELNRPEVLAANHRNYFDIAGIGDAQQQPRANWVGYWYGRNLRIFTNIVRLNARAQDRVLAIYGQGHAYLLRQFATESGAFRVMEADSVLHDK